METSKHPASTRRAAETVTPPVYGGYLCSERDLYCVEAVGPERVLLEDCRTGTLLDVSIADTAKLRPVVPAAGAG